MLTALNPSLVQVKWLNLELCTAGKAKGSRAGCSPRHLAGGGCAGEGGRAAAGRGAGKGGVPKRTPFVLVALLHMIRGREGVLARDWYSHRNAITQGLTDIAIT